MKSKYTSYLLRAVRHSFFSLIGRTDYARWSKSENYSPRWDERAALAASFCEGLGHRICDLGCGQQKLKAFLPEGTRYLPMDLDRWSEDTIVFDINSDLLPTEYLDNCDVCTALGVLNYVTDLPGFLKKLAGHVPVLVTSYNCRDLGRNNRYARGWFNYYKSADFRALLERSGFHIERECQWENGQILVRARAISRS